MCVWGCYLCKNDYDNVHTRAFICTLQYTCQHDRVKIPSCKNFEAKEGMGKMGLFLRGYGICTVAILTFIQRIRAERDFCRVYCVVVFLLYSRDSIVGRGLTFRKSGCKFFGDLAPYQIAVLFTWLDTLRNTSSFENNIAVLHNAEQACNLTSFLNGRSGHTQLVIVLFSQG